MKLEFDAVIKQHEGINGGYIEPPFDVYEVFGAKRVKVKATFDGIKYRGSLVRLGGCYMIGITREIREKSGKDFGDMIHVTLEKDDEERILELPEAFQKALLKDAKAAAFFESLSYSSRRDYIRWIMDAKREDTKIRRISQAVERLKEGKKLK